MARSSLALALLLLFVAASHACCGPCDLRPSYALLHSTSFDITGTLSETDPLTASLCGEVTQGELPGVWYTFVANADGVLTVDTCQTGWDTVIALETGTCTDHSCVDWNDDYVGCGTDSNSRSSYIIDAVTAGNTYYVLLKPYASNTPIGSYIIHVTFASSNDDVCPAGFLVVANSDISYIYNEVTLAYDSSTTSACTGDRDMQGEYYSFEPLVAGVLTVSTCGSLFDTVLSVQAGTTCYDKYCVATNDDTDQCGTDYDSPRASYLSIVVTPNVVYDVLVYPYTALTSDATYNFFLSFWAETPISSGEDFCPEDIHHYWYGRTVSSYINYDDVIEDYCWEGTYGKWYDYQPPTYKQADFYLCSDYPTELTLVENLCPLNNYNTPAECDASASADYYTYTDWCNGYAAHLTYYVTPGTTYYLLVSSNYGSVSYTLLSGDDVSWSESSSWYYSSHPWWWSSSSWDNAGLFWIVFLSLCCSLAVFICCIGVMCFCHHMCRRRNAARYQPVPTKMPEQPVVAQQPTPTPQQQQQPIVMMMPPQPTLQGQQTPQQPQQYMFVPYPYMYPAGAAPAAQQQQPQHLYPAVN